MDWRDKLSSLKSELPEGDATLPVIEVSESTKKLQTEPLRIELDKRKGKLTTLIYNFEGSDEELKELAKTLKMRCSSGGSARDGEILIQGDFRKKIAEFLLEFGYHVKRINF